MMSALTNTSALSAVGASRRTTQALNQAIERLSSGRRINSAADDAAGQAISNRMTTAIQGERQAIRNASDGISMVETSGGALTDINEQLQRIRQLTVQGVNGTLSQADRESIQDEIDERLREIDRIATTTNFNGLHLLDGSNALTRLQVGYNDDETLDVSLNPDGFGVEQLG